MVYPSRKMIMAKLMFWVTDKRVYKWAKRKKFFFILAFGRSGTLFFSTLLNKSPNAFVVHEPVRSDLRAFNDAYYNEIKAFKYIKNFRKKDIYSRIYKKDIEQYGEVNSFLRHHCIALKKNFTNLTLIHLIRDGRDVVRSAMSRNTMKNKDPSTKKIHPKNGNKWKIKWGDMSRFEKICWYWDTENRYLKSHIKKTIKFEELISDYDYFKDNLLDPLGLKISKDLWQKEVNIPKNITKVYKYPHWKQWDQKSLDTFNNICGETMRANNYKN